MTIERDDFASAISRRLHDPARTMDELRVIDDVLSGLEHGARLIGPLDLARDRRDWLQEGAQECRDLLAYLAMQKVAEAHRAREVNTLLATAVPLTDKSRAHEVISALREIKEWATNEDDNTQEFDK